MKRITTQVSAIAICAMFAPMATHAQTNLEKLGQFKTTGVTEFTYVDQTGQSADSIREMLKNIKMPDGFEINLYALVPDARHIAVPRCKDNLVVGFS